MSDIVPVIIDVIKVEIERQSELGCMANLFAVEVHAVATWREIANALKNEVIFNPQLAQSFGFWAQCKKQLLDVRIKRLFVIQPAVQTPQHEFSWLAVTRIDIPNIPSFRWGQPKNSSDLFMRSRPRNG
jgi:hypothetical protein